MTDFSAVLQGVIRGKTIELASEPGLPDGQQVIVRVQSAAAAGALPPGEGIRRSSGAWSDDAAELDEFLAWNRRQRRIERAEIAP